MLTTLITTALALVLAVAAVHRPEPRTVPVRRRPHR